MYNSYLNYYYNNNENNLKHISYSIVTIDSKKQNGTIL